MKIRKILILVSVTLLGILILYGVNHRTHSVEAEIIETTIALETEPETTVPEITVPETLTQEQVYAIISNPEHVTYTTSGDCIVSDQYIEAAMTYDFFKDMTKGEVQDFLNKYHELTVAQGLNNPSKFDSLIKDYTIDDFREMEASVDNNTVVEETTPSKPAESKPAPQPSKPAETKPAPQETQPAPSQPADTGDWTPSSGGQAPGGGIATWGAPENAGQGADDTDYNWGSLGGF